VKPPEAGTGAGTETGRESWLSRGLSLLWPRLCADCEGDLDPLRPGAFCARCEAALEWIAPPACPRCGAWVLDGRCGECPGKDFVFAGAVALGRYEGRLRDAVLRLKFRGARHLADDFGRRIAERLPRRFDAVAAVPLAGWKLFSRGYNASELLAERVAAHARLPYRRGLLKKIRRTRPQAELGLEERRLNPRGAFRARRTSGVLLLVDDVLTTGATANACAEALLAAGAAEIHAAVVGR
jgi:predicted amidophosphoribosyltransferase